MENISAVSTAAVPSGVAVIRLSGDSPLKIAEKMFSPSGKTAVKDFEPYKMYTGEIDCGGFKDFGLCVYFKAPKSFTGEDVVEFHSHGGVAITRGILNTTFLLGARLAKNGEFTKRAFINGKLSLSSAEGLIDMINGESESSARAGYSLYREKLRNEVDALQAKLTEALSNLNADLDFPEEDLEADAFGKVGELIKQVSEKIDYYLSTFRQGRTFVSGVKVGIVGKPNTGKSSLLNALISYDKAIVSDVAGTTRDIVEGSAEINGVRFNFSDTAGIRNSNDKIESLGVMLSKKVLDESDLLLFVLDSSDIDDKDEEIYNLIKDKNVLIVLNKCDVGTDEYARENIKVSALKKINIDLLRSAIYDKAVGGNVDINGDFLCEERHNDAMLRAKEKLSAAATALGVGLSADMICVDVKAAWDALGEISGKTATEEIISDIFSRFCVGK